MSSDNMIPSASDVARELAAMLDARGLEYALGRAIALGFWGEPRGTLDVDVTLFLPADKPWECVYYAISLQPARMIANEVAPDEAALLLDAGHTILLAALV